MNPDSPIISKEAALKLLDELEEFRRKHQNAGQNPSDWCMRAMSAIVARAGGFESRSEWTEKLKTDTNTRYSRDMKSGEYYYW